MIEDFIRGIAFRIDIYIFFFFATVYTFRRIKSELRRNKDFNDIAFERIYRNRSKSLWKSFPVAARYSRSSTIVKM